MAAIPEVEYLQDARRYSDMLTAQAIEDEREWRESQPVEHISYAIKALQTLSDKQLKRLIVVLAGKAAECKCHEMAIAGLDDTGDLL